MASRPRELMATAGAIGLMARFVYAARRRVEETASECKLGAWLLVHITC